MHKKLMSPTSTFIALSGPCDMRPNLPDVVLVKKRLVRGGKERAQQIGYWEEVNGNAWFPLVGGFKYIQSFSLDDVSKLLAAARQPLAGHSNLPCLAWLAELEEWTPQALDVAKCTAQNRNRPVEPEDVRAVLVRLLSAFAPLEKRIAGALKKENLNHAKLLKSRAKAYVDALKDPRTLQIYDQLSLRNSLTSAATDHRRFSWMVKAIEKDLASESAKNQKAASARNNREAFIQGPLSDSYQRLFGQKAGGNERGPFARFGECFFGLVGHPVAAGTIVRAIKPRSNNHG